MTSLSAGLDDTVPAERPITLRHLLTFTMGFGQLMAEPSDYPILAAADERKIDIDERKLLVEEGLPRRPPEVRPPREHLERDGLP